jgi:hypothetical protein
MKPSQLTFIRFRNQNDSNKLKELETARRVSEILFQK